MISIGVTGHRPHRLKVSERKLSGQVREVLRLLLALEAGDKAKKSAQLDVISPLAEGCDRIVAKVALDLGQRLTVLLPFSRRDYETTFSDQSHTREFRKLLKQADRRIKLGAKLTNAEAGYIAVGDVTLARADVVLTIWDGQPAQGRGGTPEILQNALDWRIPIIWIDAARDRKPVMLMPKARRGAQPILAKVAIKAQPLTPKALRAALGRS